MPVSLHLLPTFEHNGESGAICLQVVVVDVLSLQATEILRDWSCPVSDTTFYSELMYWYLWK